MRTITSTRLQCAQHLLLNHRNGLHAVQFNQQPDTLVIIDQWRGLLRIDRQAFADRFLAIIVALVEFATTRITLSSSPRWIEGQMETASATSTNISWSIASGEITISWPASHTGWFLQVQTNQLSVGLADNWVTIPGSDQTNSFTLPVDPANPTVFYRMSFQQ